MTRELPALKLRSRYSSNHDPVFAARNGKPLKHRNATRRGSRAPQHRAGIEGVARIYSEKATNRSHQRKFAG